MTQVEILRALEALALQIPEFNPEDDGVFLNNLEDALVLVTAKLWALQDQSRQWLADSLAEGGSEPDPVVNTEDGPQL